MSFNPSDLATNLEGYWPLDTNVRDCENVVTTSAAEINSNQASSERGAGVHFVSRFKAYSIKKASFSLNRLGSPTGNLVAKVFKVDSSGLPTSQQGSNSASVDMATISTSQGWVEFEFTTPIQHTGECIVMLEIDGAYTGDGSNFIRMFGTGSNSNPQRWRILKSNSDVYTSATGDDVGFRLIVDQTDEMLTDLSGNGNDLTNNNTVEPLSENYFGENAGAADFERSNSEYLSIADGSQTGLDAVGADISFACWIKRESSGQSQYIVSKGEGGASVNGYYMRVTAGNVLECRMGATSGNTITGTTTISANKWYHVAMVAKFGEEGVLYVNGQVDATDDYTSISASGGNSDPFNLGADRTNGTQWDGGIWRAGFWSRALTPLEVLSLAMGVNLSEKRYLPTDVSTQPDHVWPLNELSGNALDAVGSLNGTVQGVTVGGGILDGAARLGNGTQYFELAASTDYDMGTGDWSWCGWARFDATATETFFDFGQYGSAAGLMSQITSNTWYCMSNGNIQSVSFTADTDTWYFFTLKRTGGLLYFYVDGELLGTVANTYDIQSSSNVGRLMAYNTSTDPIQGSMQYQALWKGYALTDEEISNLAQGFDPNLEGLVYYYTLDEESGERADSSPDENGLNLTDNNTVVGTVSPIGDAKGAYFDGTGDYLTVPDSADFDFGTGDFTMEAYVLHWSTTGTQIYMSRNNDLSLRFNSGSLECVIASSIVSTYTWTPDLYKWYHVAVSRSGSTIKLFIDGVEVDSDTNSTNISSSNGFGFGANFNGTDPFDGYMRNVRISDNARYTGAFSKPTSEFVNDVNTEVLLLLSEDKGVTTFTDSSTAARTVTTNGDVEGSYVGVTSSGAAFFEQSNSEYLSRAEVEAGLANFGKDFTIMAWANRESSAGASGRGIVDKDYGSSQSGGALRQMSTQRFQACCRTTSVNGTTQLTIGEFAHGVSRYDGATVKVYYNSQEEGSSNSTNDPIPAQTPLYVGRDESGDYFDGLVDEVGGFRRYLRPQEIKAFYNRGRNGFTLISEIGGGGTSSNKGFFALLN